MSELSDLQATRQKLQAEIKAAQNERARIKRAEQEIDKPASESERKRKLQDERQDLHRRVDQKQKRLDAVEEKIAKLRRVSADEALNSRACLDGATTWKCLQLVLIDCRQNGGWTGVLNAADRTPAHVDDCGNKCSQDDLYHKRPGCCCAPANPPGQGSHEGVNGGSPAFRDQFAYGAALPHWAWGLDVSGADQLLAACAELGYAIFRPYDNESWHCNLHKDPRPRLRERGLIG